MFNISKETLTLLVSIFSLFLSLANTGYLIFINRKSINISYKKLYDCSEFNDKSMFFNFIIENKSRLKISISRVIFVLGNQKLEFSDFPVRVYNNTTTTGKTVTSSFDVYSKTFPQDIDGLSSIGGLFEIANFPFEDFYNSNSFSLEIYTSRGLIIKKLPVLNNNN